MQWQLAMTLEEPERSIDRFGEATFIETFTSAAGFEVRDGVELLATRIRCLRSQPLLRENCETRDPSLWVCNPARYDDFSPGV